MSISVLMCVGLLLAGAPQTAPPESATPKAKKPAAQLRRPPAKARKPVQATKPAQAFSLFNVPINTYQAGNTNQSLTVTDGLGGSAQVQFIITDQNGRLTPTPPQGQTMPTAVFPWATPCC